ncbi:glycoside hydrolase family 3 C-terminal domain-containing protein [Amycolatopsis sp. NBC_01307]|uniref:glycoside hydrolase family 3 C-terminal domain-containing protein n=1 Tax=Amycolatopsis sp. NBC_01307 TaxID=2903561 RepID=UPI002E100082|nr:glycoside hydrolase family 3 C-terminal domain-containing protein [Amycolatopsis sp. NBC_01307]
MAHTRPAHRYTAFAVAALSGIAVTAAVVTDAAVAAPAPGTPIYRDTHYSFAERAADLVSRMTLPEKVQQLHTNNAPAIPRLGVQQYTYWSEGQHGLNRLGGDAGAGGQGDVDDVHATSFPVNFAATMSWDPALTYAETTAISDEARGFLDKSLFGTGQNNIGPNVGEYGDLTYWAPTVNLDRDPRWGRTDEAFGEDPYLVGKMAGAFVDGYQGYTLDGTPMTPYLKVAATAKHYALNNVEDDRLSGDSPTTEADLHQYYLRQFQKLVEDDHVSGLMTSYNAIDGTPGAVNTYLVNQLAQRTFGFDGYTTSDCDAIATAWQPPPGGHLWAAPGWRASVAGAQVIWTNTTTGATIPAAAGAEAYGLRAGTQLNCTGDQATLTNIQAAIDAGILSEGVLDAGLVRLFTTRMATGEFDPADRVGYTKIGKSVIESPAHQALATKVADNSMVLLKNAPLPGGAPLLPADPAKTAKVVVLGDLANTVTLGGYSGQPTHTVNAVQGIRAALPNASVVFDAAGTSTTATTPAVLSEATKAAVRAADLVVIAAGTDRATAGEGHDRASLALPGNYTSLIDQVSALGNPRTALALQTLGPVALGDIEAKVPAILFSGYNGQSQGTALADVLFGAQNPDGHLDFTWYQGDAQLPDVHDYGLSAAATGGLGRTYQYFTGAPTRPFGYGLSYSTFRFSRVAADHQAVSADGTVNVSLDVTNTGQRPGTTVAQLYVATPGAGTGDEPLQRLAGFRKTQSLAPGQTQHLVLPVRVRDLALWDTAHSRETVADGTYQFRVGTDAATIVARKDVQVTGTPKPRVKTVTVQPEAVVYHPGQSLDLTGANRWLADDTNPAEQPDRDLGIVADDVVEAVNDDQSFVDLAHAHVAYQSSNPDVASVDGKGIVHTIKDGVATITATVNGVSGSAPIVVTGTLTSTVPAFLAAGEQGTATATFVNGSTKDVRGLAVAIALPAGWTATPSTPAGSGRVPAGASVTVKWTVTAEADAQPGTYPIGFTATSSAGTFTSSGDVKVPYGSVAAAYNNSGISDDGLPAAGAFDGSGLNYSAQALAAAGFAPGQPVTAGGITFAWPRPNVPDNVIAAGQVLPVSGSGRLLGFLGASAFGSTSAPGTVVYTDGSTQSYTLSFADWWSGSASPGTSIAATTPYINVGPDSARQNQNVHVYLAWTTLDPAKTVRYVVLPDSAPGQAAGSPATHVFAVGVGQPAGGAAIVGDSFGDPDSAHGASVRDGDDGRTIPVTAGGLPARTTTGAASPFVYLDLDDGVVPGGSYQATAYVSYFDRGTGSWNIQYDSGADVPNNAYRESAAVTGEDTGTWRTAVVPLPDAAFANRENNHSDLRLNIGTGGLAIGRIAVTVTGGDVVPIQLTSAEPTAPVVSQQPQDATAAPDATFTAYAVGDPAPLVRWQQWLPGGEWADVPAATSPTLTVSGAADGTQYRAVFTNLAGSTTSDPATLHVG